MSLKKLGAAAVILDDRGIVLMVKHTYGHCAWELPGGDAEPNESLEETVIREVQEESGLRVVVERLTGLYYDISSDYHQAVFLCHPEDTSAPLKPDGKEVTECKYWSLGSLPNPHSDYTVLRIHDALGHKAALGVTRISSPNYT